MRRVERDASPTPAQNRFAVLAEAEEDGVEEDEAEGDVQMHDAHSDSQRPILAPIPCSLPGLAASCHAHERANTHTQPSSTAPAGPTQAGQTLPTRVPGPRTSPLIKRP